jgi:ketosteroid isomerase-like protein
VAAVAGILLALPAQTQGVHPRRNDQFKHQVEQLEQIWRTAELNGDVAAMDKLLSDDFVGITMNGQVVTKMQQLDRLRRRTTVLSRMDLRIEHVKLIGMTTAVVQSLAEVEGSNEGEPMHGTFRYTRVYLRQPSGTWQITNYEATRVGPPQPPPQGRGPGPGGPVEPAAKPAG